MHADFRNVMLSRGFTRDFAGPCELERDYEDHGESLSSLKGGRPLGFDRSDEDHPGLGDGQRAVRTVASEALRL